jgi:hypothetical protein
MKKGREGILEMAVKISSLREDEIRGIGDAFADFK